jgi:proline racemase
MTLLVTGYKSKKELKEATGKPLKYRETSMFGEEYKATGSFVVAHRPAINPQIGGREFFAKVTMRDGLIAKVE